MRVKSICVAGIGYVGLTTGTCFADLGNRVCCVDVDRAKVQGLNSGELPIYEPGLEELVLRNHRAERLLFTTSYEEAMADADFVFIAVNTPSGANGEADLRYVNACARSIAETMTKPIVIVNKSTVPIGTGDWVANVVTQHLPEPIPFSVVSNPEFLREGSAVHDFLQPDRVVLGSSDSEAAAQVARLYLPLRCPILITDIRTAEMIKYASNAFLATRISFINEIASICQSLGADVKEVALGMGYDKRIGHAFLDAGLGWGGSCFPKDVRALAHMAAIHGCHPQLLRAVMEINHDQRRQVVQKLRDQLGSLYQKVVAILGLSFKPNTDDMRDAPSVEVIRLLQTEGAMVRAYDPVAASVAAKILPDVELCASAYEAARGADALVVATEWNEFKHLDLEKIRDSMRRPVVVDGRNIYEPSIMRQLGFTYQGIGRP